MDYNTDGRRPVDELLNLFQTGLITAGWSREVICNQMGESYNPILAFKSPTVVAAQPTFWILGGIHGEEPAPTEAFADELPTIIELGKTVPVIFLPLLNPQGRRIDWRYENEYRDFHKGLSVTAFTPPQSATAITVSTWITQNSHSFPPRLVIDHHEDLVPAGVNLTSCYVYASGGHPDTPHIANLAIEALRQSGMPIVDSGKTRFGETISNGVIANAQDGSVDAYLSSPSNTVLVVETTIPFNQSLPLPARVAAHRAIIRRYPSLWNLVCSNPT